MHICVFCSSSQRIDRRYLELADAVGTELARRGHTLVSGGAIVSCMGAVASAVRRGGGRTIGVIPQLLVDVEVADEDSDELIVTDGMRERKAIMDARSDAFLVLPGGIGTLEELFEIWTTRTLGLHTRPVVVLDPWGFYRPLRELIQGMNEAGFTRPDVLDMVAWTTTPAEAFAVLEAAPPRVSPTGEALGEALP